MPSIADIQPVNRQLIQGNLTPSRLSDIRENRDLVQEQAQISNQAGKIQNQAMIQQLQDEPLLREVRLKAIQGDPMSQAILYSMRPGEWTQLQGAVAKMSSEDRAIKEQQTKQAAAQIQAGLLNAKTPQERAALIKQAGSLGAYELLLKQEAPSQSDIVKHNIGGVDRFFIQETEPNGSVKLKEISQSAAQGSALNLTPDEQKAVGPIEGKLSANQERIVRLMRNGVPRETAIDLADKNLRVITDPVTGESSLTNLRTGQVQKISQQQADAINGLESELSGQQGRQIAEDIQTAAGPVGAASRFFTNTFGFLVPGVNKATPAKQRVEQFNKMLEVRLVENPRHPVAEREAVKKDLMSDVSSVFRDPEAELGRLFNLRDFLVLRQRIAEQKLKQTLSRDERKITVDIIADYKALLDSIGDLPATVEDFLSEPTNESKSYSEAIRNATSIEEIERIKKEFGR